MDILYRTATPAYRGCTSQPQQRSTNILSGLWCYLFGSGSAPTYRTKGANHGSAVTSAPRCWWQAFPATPQYKAAPSADLAPAPDDGAGCECPEEDLTDEDVPSVVQVWTE